MVRFNKLSIFRLCIVHKSPVICSTLIPALPMPDPSSDFSELLKGATMKLSLMDRLEMLWESFRQVCKSYLHSFDRL